MQRTDQELLSIGERVTEIISDPVFNLLYSEYRDQAIEAFATSKPHETKLREFEYAKLQALGGFLSHLVSQVEAAENAKMLSLLDDASDD